MLDSAKKSFDSFDSFDSSKKESKHFSLESKESRRTLAPLPHGTLSLIYGEMIQSESKESNESKDILDFVNDFEGEHHYQGVISTQYFVAVATGENCNE